MVLSTDWIGRGPHLDGPDVDMEVKLDRNEPVGWL